MKRLLLLIAVSIVWSGSVLQAQEYVPFVHKGACGDTYAYDPYVKDCDFGYYNYNWGSVSGFTHYRIQGETNMNGKTYKGLYSLTGDSSASSEQTLIAFVREENKKVYFMDGEKEWPWYDFTLEKGDTWTIEAESPLSRHGEEIEVVVSNVDTITIGGKSRKRISFQGYYSWVDIG